MNGIQKIPLYVVGLIVSLLVLANAVSSVLQVSEPQLALIFNPANTEAVVGLATMDETRRPGNWSNSTKSAVRNGLRISPADARLHSLAGMIAEQTGDNQTASVHFDSALFLLPTEYQASVRMLLVDVRAKNFEQAAVRAELLARRWPDRWSIVAPFMSPMLSDPVLGKAIADRFAPIPERRMMVLTALLKDNQNLTAALNLVLRWKELGVPDMENEIGRLIGSLLTYGAYDAAHDLFLQTRTPLQLKEAGYINNSRFNLPTTNNPFDWRIRSQSGVEIRRVNATGDADDAHVELSFLGRPLQLRSLSQSLILVPGTFRLTVRYQAKGLKTPKPIKIVLNCVEKPNVIGSLNLGEGSTELITQTLDVKVPPSECQLARAQVITDRVPFSLRYGLHGALKLFEISLKKID